MNQPLQYKAMRAFEAVVRCGSVKAAAEDLHVTTGAISQQLRRFEGELGSALFKRKGRNLIPTREALDLAHEFGAAFENIASAIDRYRQLRDCAPLHIATLPSLGTRLIVPSLSKFRAYAPDIRVSFTYVHQPSDFSLDEADVLLCTVDGLHQGPGVSRPIVDGAVFPVCSPAYMERLRDTPSPQDLLNADLLHDCDTIGWERWFEKAGVETESPLVGDVYEDFGLLGAAALAGQGVALCPMHLIGQELARQDLVLVSDIATREERTYCVIVPDEPRADALVFADWVVSLGSADGREHGS